MGCKKGVLILIVVEDSLVPYVCIPLDVNEMS